MAGWLLRIGVVAVWQGGSSGWGSWQDGSSGPGSWQGGSSGSGSWQDSSSGSGSWQDSSSGSGSWQGGSWQGGWNDWSGQDWSEWWQDQPHEWSDGGPADRSRSDRSVDVSQYSWLGGSKKNSLPLTEQRKLLRESVLENVSALSMLGWGSETLSAVFWMCFAVDISSCSVLSLGRSSSEICDQLKVAFAEKFPEETDRQRIRELIRTHARDPGQLVREAQATGFQQPATRDVGRGRPDYRGDSRRNGAGGFGWVMRCFGIKHL